MPTSQWATATPLLGGEAPAWVPAEHQERVRAYDLYDDMYWNVKDTFRLVHRGTESALVGPIYIPNPRIIVDTVARYVAKGLSFAASPRLVPGESAPPSDETTLAQQWFQSLFDREMFLSKFAMSKVFGIVRGDYLFHVIGDENRPEGRRLTIKNVHPGNYFPVYADVTDPDSLQAVFLADVITMPDDKQFVRRQRYTRTRNDDGSATITSDLALFELDKWFPVAGEDEPEPVNVEGFTAIPPTPLDDRITTIPVYHIQHNPEPNRLFGNSELRGLERVLASVNQSITDEELTLVLEGLGVYATDAGSPVDDEGNPKQWVLGPGRVLEHQPGGKFYRVNAANTVGPFQDHLKYLEDKVDEATGVNDVAKGKVEVSVAESGIALALRLSPLFARVDLDDTHVTGKLGQMYFDLSNAWLPVYEGVDFPATEVRPTLGDKLPLNKKERFEQLMILVDKKLVSKKWARVRMMELGYEIPENIEEEITAETEAESAALDMVGARVNAEANGGPVPGELVDAGA
jgi:hypothetical protein